MKPWQIFQGLKSLVLSHESCSVRPFLVGKTLDTKKCHGSSSSPSQLLSFELRQARRNRKGSAGPEIISTENIFSEDFCLWYFHSSPATIFTSIVTSQRMSPSCLAGEWFRFQAKGRRGNRWQIGGGKHLGSQVWKCLFWTWEIRKVYPPEVYWIAPEKWMVGRWSFPFGFWSLFRGELLNFGRV